MNTLQKGITTLLRCAITGESLPLPADFRLEDAMPLIRTQEIATLTYEGAVRCGMHRKDPAMRELFRIYYTMMLQSEQQVREIERIFGAFESGGVDFLPLKGSKMKSLYPRPELRVMGDADVLIRMEQYRQKIKPLMEEHGFTFVNEADHEIGWKTDGLRLELHKRLIPSQEGKYHAFFGDGWRLAVPDRGSRYTMTPEDEFLFLFTHFTKHYRFDGIGCRHVVDIWVYLRSHPGLEEARVHAGLEELGLLEFYRSIRWMLRVWFEDAEADERADLMTEFVFSGGSWGSIKSRMLSTALLTTRGSARASHGKLGFLSSRMFPGVRKLERKYTILRKAPWLLPLVWVYRPFYKVLFERRELQQMEQQMELISRENLEERIRFLQLVGLDETYE